MLHLYLGILVFGSLLLILLGWQQRKCWQLIWQLNGWRGVMQQPLLWCLLWIYLDPKSVLDSLTRLRSFFHRPLAVVVGTRIMLYIDDPVSMEGILNAPECLDKSFLQEGFFARRGLLHARGQKWKLRRRQLNPAFNHNIVASFFGVFNEVGNKLVAQFTKMPHLHGNVVRYKDAEDMLSRAVLEVSCLTIMGTATDFTESDHGHIAETYKRLLEISAMKIVKPWLQIDCLHRLLSKATYEESYKCNKLLEEFVAQIIEQKHTDWQTRTQHQEQQQFCCSKQRDNYLYNYEGLVGSEINSNIEAEDSWRRRIFIEQIFSLAATGELTLQDVMDEAQSMVLVSFETVSNSIIIALLCLALEPKRNGDCQRRLREEINHVLSGGNAMHISMEHLQQMTYLDAFVNESLRLMATVPMNLRHVSRDFQLRTTTNGSSKDAEENVKYVTVPENSIIVLDTFNMQRDMTWWGPNAQQFEPERFLSQSSETTEADSMLLPPSSSPSSPSSSPQSEGRQQQFGPNCEQQEKQKPRRHSYSFLPFSKGLRTCIGRRYSFFMMKVFLVKLIAAFEFHTTQKLEHLRFVEGISLKFRNANDIIFQIKPVCGEQARQEEKVNS